MLTSELLAAAGIRHGFSTREDGDARGEGIPRKLAASLGAEGVATCAQVHGTAIIWPEMPGRAPVEADGLATRGGLAVGVLSADCVPILLVDPGSGLGAAVHAGWRGTLAGVAAAGLETLRAFGARTERVLVAVGPRIKPCCYEVGEDLAQRFAARFARGVERRNSSVFIDLDAAIRVQLEEKGLRQDQVGTLDHCTCCGRGPDGGFRFHSYRREGPVAGRQLSIIGM